MTQEEQETLILIQSVRNKDRVAEEKFYNRYKKIIENYIKHNLPKVNDDFDDCVQHVLIKIFLNLDKYDPEKSSFKSWVIAITKNFMVDTWRSGAITMRTSPDNLFTVNNTGTITIPEWTNSIITSSSLSNSSSFASSCVFTTNNACNFENCNSLNYLSNQLSPVDFTLLNMKYVQGYDYCEIGKEFNMSSNTASNKVNYIKTKLKKNNSKVLYD